jgi:hypothetical protein
MKTASNRICVAIVVVLISVAATAQVPKTIADPLFGILYDPHGVHFERLPPLVSAGRVRKICSSVWRGRKISGKSTDGCNRLSRCARAVGDIRQTSCFAEVKAGGPDHQSRNRFLTVLNQNNLGWPPSRAFREGGFPDRQSLRLFMRQVDESSSSEV